MDPKYVNEPMRASLTRHVCPACGKKFFIRASFTNCPFCGGDVQGPVILDRCVTIYGAIREILPLYAARYALRVEITRAIADHLPGYSAEVIDAFYQEQ